jgi:hypothetical protein
MYFPELDDRNVEITPLQEVIDNLKTDTEVLSLLGLLVQKYQY